MSTTWYDTIATLGWLAGITTDIKLLSHVYVIALRHPLRAAKEFATLDALSAGRVICGVGAGHVTEEFDQMGPEFDRRGAATDEAIVGLAKGLADEYPVLDGPRWKASGLGLRPRPVQSPRPPIWSGGSSPAALRRTARFADGWLPQSLGPNVELLADLRRLREEYRDGAPLDIGALAHPLSIGSPPSSGELPRGTVSGPPEQLAEYLRTFVAAGVGQVQVRFPSRSADELCDQVTAFGAEVIPLIDT
jgi:alkanesulfonate monooxygenase SsuD/methylene tetrahydromethanopterin reductase-like flavin-dependent oxidoreductase (luciferase family)